MLKEVKEIRTKFLNKFHYCPEISWEAATGEKKASEEYCKVLQKCIDDNFDYTIELYGTIPRTSEGLPEIIID